MLFVLTAKVSFNVHILANMKNEIRLHLDRALTHYTSGRYYERLLEAKDEYFSLTGQVNEDDEDYELYELFNDWYIFQFVSKLSNRAAIFDYIDENELDETLISSLMEMNYSLFEYCGRSFRGFCSFKDILHNYKFVLPKKVIRRDFLRKTFLLGELLSGRKIITCFRFMPFPKEIRGKLVKQSKKLRKLNDRKKEIDFLLKVESLKTKWVRYGHIKPDRIFSFDF